MVFDDFKLCDALRRGVEATGFNKPTPVQDQVIPPALEGKDLLVFAETGTGKTAAYGLPILERLSRALGVTKPLTGRAKAAARDAELAAARAAEADASGDAEGEKSAAPGESGAEESGKPTSPATGSGTPPALFALILGPTREVVTRSEGSLRSFGNFMPARIRAIFGGVPAVPQRDALRRGLHIVAATPGRLAEILRQQEFPLDKVQVLVLDEIDHLVQMNLMKEVNSIVERLPKDRQTYVFANKRTAEIETLAREYMRDPMVIEIARLEAPLGDIHQVLYPVEAIQKNELLLDILKDQSPRKAVVFFRTRRSVDKLQPMIEGLGRKVAALHADRTPAQRQQAIEAFSSGEADTLVATEMAVRSLEVENITHLINFDLPQFPDDYVNRIARCSQADPVEKVISLVSAEDRDSLRRLEKHMGKTIERVKLEGFAYLDRGRRSIDRFLAPAGGGTEPRAPRAVEPESASVPLSGRRPRRPSRPLPPVNDERLASNMARDAEGNGEADEKNESPVGRSSLRSPAAPAGAAVSLAEGSPEGAVSPEAAGAPPTGVPATPPPPPPRQKIHVVERLSGRLMRDAERLEATPTAPPIRDGAATTLERLRPAPPAAVAAPPAATAPAAAPSASAAEPSRPKFTLDVEKRTPRPREIREALPEKRVELPERREAAPEAPETPERTARPERADRPERTERPDRFERPPRSERFERGRPSDRNERPERPAGVPLVVPRGESRYPVTRADAPPTVTAGPTVAPMEKDELDLPVGIPTVSFTSTAPPDKSVPAIPLRRPNERKPPEVDYDDSADDEDEDIELLDGEDEEEDEEDESVEDATREGEAARAPGEAREGDRSHGRSRGRDSRRPDRRVRRIRSWDLHRGGLLEPPPLYSTPFDTFIPEERQARKLDSFRQALSEDGMAPAEEPTAEADLVGGYLLQWIPIDWDHPPTRHGRTSRFIESWKGRMDRIAESEKKAASAQPPVPGARPIVGKPGSQQRAAARGGEAVPPAGTPPVTAWPLAMDSDTSAAAAPGVWWTPVHREESSRGSEQRAEPRPGSRPADSRSDASRGGRALSGRPAAPAAPPAGRRESPATPTSRSAGPPSRSAATPPRPAAPPARPAPPPAAPAPPVARIPERSADSTPPAESGQGREPRQIRGRRGRATPSPAKTHSLPPPPAPAGSAPRQPSLVMPPTPLAGPATSKPAPAPEPVAAKPATTRSRRSAAPRSEVEGAKAPVTKSEKPASPRTRKAASSGKADESKPETPAAARTANRRASAATGKKAVQTPSAAPETPSKPASKRTTSSRSKTAAKDASPLSGAESAATRKAPARRAPAKKATKEPKPKSDAKSSGSTGKATARKSTKRGAKDGK